LDLGISVQPASLKLSEGYEARPGTTVREAMMKHDGRPEAVMRTRDGELRSEDEIIREGQTLRSVAAVSGGMRAPCAVRLWDSTRRRLYCG